MAMICANCLASIDAGALRCPACAADPLLAGRYRLERALRDQLGDIGYRGTQVQDGRLVRIRSLDVRDADHGQRLAKAAERGALDDPDLPGLLGLEHSTSGDSHRLWLVHEHRGGRVLAERTEAHALANIAPSWTLGIVESVAAILDRLHRRDPCVVHGALTAHTILVAEPEHTDPPRVVLLDRALTDEPPDPTRDIWSLGVIVVGLYAPDAAQALREDPSSLTWRARIALGAVGNSLVGRMLDRDPRRRISAAELRSLAAQARAPRPPKQPPAEKPASKVIKAASKPRTPPSSPKAAPASPRFLMAEPMPSTRDGSSSIKQRVVAKRARRAVDRDSDIPVMRPDELSHELSQAHRATSAIEQRQRKHLTYARMLVVLVAATIAALATYIAVNL